MHKLLFAYGINRFCHDPAHISKIQNDENPEIIAVVVLTFEQCGNN